MRFHKKSGIFEAPPAMLASIGKRATAIYYGHIWSFINPHIEQIQKNLQRGTRFQKEDQERLVKYVQVREECRKHAKKPKSYKSKAQFKAPVDFRGSRYENLWKKGLERLKKEGQELSSDEIKVVIDFQGHVKRGGQWSNWKKQLEVDVSSKSAASLETLEEGKKKLLRVLRHELQHVAQDYLAEVMGLKEDAGLPSKKIRTPFTSPSGQVQKNTPEKFRNKQQDRVRHMHRDVEFYTNLMDEVHTFENYLKYIPKLYWYIAARIYLGMYKHPRRAEADFVSEISDSYDKKVYPLRTSSRFLEFKKKNPAKWKKAVKEFLTELRKRGVNLDEGIRELFPLFEAKVKLSFWRRKVDHRYGYDKGDHKRVKQGWVLELYEIENYKDIDKSGWESKPGKEKFYVLVTPSGKIKQIGGLKRLPHL